MRSVRLVSSLALVAATLLSGCKSDQQAALNGTNNSSGQSTNHVANLTLPSGTAIDVSLNSPISSETATAGSGWTGTTRSALLIDGHDVVPAGSSVSGTIVSVKPARKGDRAMLDLGLTSITVGDRTYRVNGSTEAVIAGSPRARNLGAIGAATAAGAIIGHQVGGSGKGTLIGAVVGAGAATAVVSQTKGWQVVLKAGTPLTFTTSEAVAVRA